MHFTSAFSGNAIALGKSMSIILAAYTEGGGGVEGGGGIPLVPLTGAGADDGLGCCDVKLVVPPRVETWFASDDLMEPFEFSVEIS